MKSKFKVGDIVFSEREYEDDYRDKQYIPVFKVQEINGIESNYLRPEFNVCTGIHEKHCRFATDEEIKQYASHLLKNNNMKTQKVQREYLAEIYENVCQDWQNKINTLLNSSKFSSEIEIPNDLILEAYGSADKDVQKKWLATHLPKPKSIIDEVNSYEDACNILGIEARTLKEFETFYGKEKAKRKYSEHRITTGIEAINGEWKADWNDDNQRKYIVWMYNENNGFWFFVVYQCHGSPSGGDLYIENYDKCKKIYDVFLEDFKIYYF